MLHWQPRGYCYLYQELRNILCFYLFRNGYQKVNPRNLRTAAAAILLVVFSLEVEELRIATSLITAFTFQPGSETWNRIGCYGQHLYQHGLIYETRLTTPALYINAQTGAEGLSATCYGQVKSIKFCPVSPSWAVVLKGLPRIWVSSHYRRGGSFRTLRSVVLSF